MIPEVIRYRIPAAATTEFVQAYRYAGEVLKQSTHCQGFELIQSTKDPEMFLLIIRWDSAQGHLDGFRKSPQFRPFFELVKPFLSNILEMEHYRSADLSWTPA